MQIYAAKAAPRLDKRSPEKSRSHFIQFIRAKKILFAKFPPMLPGGPAWHRLPARVSSVFFRGLAQLISAPPQGCRRQCQLNYWLPAGLIVTSFPTLRVLDRSQLLLPDGKWLALRNLFIRFSSGRCIRQFSLAFLPRKNVNFLDSNALGTIATGWSIFDTCVLVF